MILVGNICKWGNELKIKKIEVKKRKNIKELFEGYEGTYKTETIEWREPVGKEI
uniref:hypothetical protein n=1 Tax=Fusobacterium mortiferum TaxID=850 RepID=UPI003FF0F110